MVTTHNKRTVEYVSEDLLRRSIQILEAGMQRFPDDHRFPMRIAFNYYYELGDVDRAIPYFVRAAYLPDAPDWLKHKLVDLFTKKGRTELARQTLSELVMEADEPVLKKSLRDRLVAVMSEDERRKIIASRQAIIQEWQSSYGYIPLELYLLIREP
jgi:tetratricopeptide (TPR) repeat protein